MKFEQQYLKQPYQMSELERKLLGLFCSYYAYLESMDNLATNIDKGRGGFPSQLHARRADDARKNTIRRLGLFGEGMTDKEFNSLRDQALRFTYEEQLLFATQTKMYEEFLKEFRITK